jgi:hypothetical protein
MITVTIWHNVAGHAEGRHIPMLDGYHDGDPVVAVFTYQASPAGRTAEQIAEEAFGIFNGHPRNPGDADLSRSYYQRSLRSLSVGDVVAVGGTLLAVGRPAGWDPVPGPLTRVRTRAHGTNPLSLPDGALRPPATGQ